ncbi:unnamed protein product [Chrysoparadoxa australica]
MRLAVFACFALQGQAFLQQFPPNPRLSSLHVATRAEDISAPHAKDGSVIIGAGPTGLATAIMLAKRGYKNIKVYERLSEPPLPASAEWGDAARSYNLGIGGRGQTSLTKLGVLDSVSEYCALAIGVNTSGPRLNKLELTVTVFSPPLMQRKDWGGLGKEPAERIFTERKYKTMVIQRDRLAACLLKFVREKYKSHVSVEFDVECIDADISTAGCNLKFMRAGGSVEEVKAKLAVGADGVRSTLRSVLAEAPSTMKELSGGKLKVMRFQDNNARYYRTIGMTLPADWRNDLNYSARSTNGVTLEALPTVEGKQVGLVLFKPGEPLVDAVKTLPQARQFFQDLFPQFRPFLTDEAMKGFAERPLSKLPTFTYVYPILHAGGVCVLLGDTIKSVKPYFGLGVNSAFEDVCVLNDCLNEAQDDLSQALPLFSKKRAKEAKTLVNLSRSFDHTGIKSTFLFVVPIILDSILSKWFPKLIATNTISMLQRADLSFTQIARRKWLDRLAECILVTAMLSAVSLALGRLGPLAFAFIAKQSWLRAIMAA